MMLAFVLHQPDDDFDHGKCIYLNSNHVVSVEDVKGGAVQIVMADGIGHYVQGNAADIANIISKELTR